MPDKRFPLGGETLQIFIRWTALSILVGFAAGFIGIAFHFTLEWCTITREANNWLIFFLPVAGIIIAWLYKHFGEGDRGTNMVLSAVRSNERMRAVTAPLIFIGTTFTHLFGGSAGREGAALQLGGSIATQIGSIFHLDEKDSHIIVMCGTSAAFAALFGTPITAAIFSLEVVSVGLMYYSAIVPCVLSALTGSMLASAFGIIPMAYKLSVPILAASNLLRILLLGILCAGVSILFCFLMRKATALCKTYLHNLYLRAVCGGIAVLILTLLLHTHDYNGAGMDVITHALQGQAKPWDFLFKMIFTALTLSSGYKGGEIVPAFFTGATFGCVAGGLLGLNPAFGAGIGMIAVFCGVTNCPVTSMLLSVELFGAEGLPFFAAAVAVSYMLSGYGGLYGEQKIVYSKIKSEFIDIKAK